MVSPEPNKGGLDGEQVSRLLSRLADASTGWFEPWYVRLRLEEEVLRAGRYQRPLSIVGFRVAVSAVSEEQRRDFLQALAAVPLQGLRSSDLPGALGPDEYFVILPETERSGAEVVMARLGEALSVYSPECHMAVFGEDGNDSSSLLAKALAT